MGQKYLQKEDQGQVLSTQTSQRRKIHLWTEVVQQEAKRAQELNTVTNQRMENTFPNMKKKLK